VSIFPVGFVLRKLNLLLERDDELDLLLPGVFLRGMRCRALLLFLGC
jgi:hypothetical protein